MSKPNVTRVQSATQWTASVHTLHMSMSKPNVTRVQSATQWTASVHTLHMSKPNVTRPPKTKMKVGGRLATVRVEVNYCSTSFQVWQLSFDRILFAALSGGMNSRLENARYFP